MMVNSLDILSNDPRVNLASFYFILYVCVCMWVCLLGINLKLFTQCLTAIAQR